MFKQTEGSAGAPPFSAGTTQAEHARRGLKQKDLAQIIGAIRQSYANKLKHGSFTPSDCRALCAYFEMGFVFLFVVEALAS